MKGYLHTIGAILINLGVCIGAATRAIAYSEILGVARESPGPKILSDDGELLWVYALLWGLCAFMAILDACRKKIGMGLMSFIPLMAWWCFSYFLAWAYSHFHSWDWMTVGIYLAALLIIVGFILMVYSFRKAEMEKSPFTQALRKIERE